MTKEEIISAKEIVQKHIKGVYRFDGLIHGDVNANDIVKAMQEYADQKAKPLVEALQWYQEQAEAATRYSIAKNGQGLEAIVVALSLDAGNRGKEALTNYNNNIK